MPEELMDIGAMDAGGGGESDVAVAEPEVEVSTETEQPETQQTDTTQTDSEQQPRITDLKSAFKELQKANPKLHDFIRKEHYKLANELSQLKETYELDGGAEGIERLKGEAQEYAQALTRAANGDAELWDEIHADSPDGAAKLAMAGIDKLERFAPDKFELVKSRMVSRSLSQSGFAGTLGNLLEIIREGGADAQKYALREAQKLANWVAQTDEFSRQQQTTSDEGKNEVEERARSLDQREYKIYHEDVGRATNQRMSSIVSKSLAPLMQGKKLTNEQRQGLASETYSIISASLAKNEMYKRALKAQLSSKKDPQEIARWVATKVQEIAPKAAKMAWGRRGFGTAPASTNGNAQARTVVNGKPKSEDIDWGKDPQRTRYMHGEATLKNGSVVRWNWDKV